MKNKLYYISLAVIVVVFIVVVPKMFVFEKEYTGENDFYISKVTEIKSDVEKQEEDYDEREITFVSKITFGLKRGSQQIVKQYISDSFYGNSEPVEVGDTVIITKADEDEHFSFVAKSRLLQLIIMTLLFILLIIAIGGKKGVLTIVTLSLTVIALFSILIPAILSGTNVYLITTIVVVFIIFTTISILSGYGKKSFCAIFGNILGVVLAAGLTLLFNHVLGITGIVDEDYLFLSLQENGPKIDLIAVVWSSIIIGSLGAVMDVSISISSSLEEIAKEMKVPKKTKLIKAGMNIGRDIIGTMTNTLILAYVGSSLAVILLFTLYNRNLLFLFNLEMIVVEISQAIIGSMAVIITVPATVVIGAIMYSNTAKENK